MTHVADFIQVNLQVVLPNTVSEEETDMESSRLKRQLREAGFTITHVQEAAPSGVKSPVAFTLGALTVALLPKVVPQLIQVLNEWLAGRASRKLKLRLPTGLEFELTGSMSPSETKQLIEKLIAIRAPKTATVRNRG